MPVSRDLVLIKGNFMPVFFLHIYAKVLKRGLHLVPRQQKQVLILRYAEENIFTQKKDSPV
jgi:hypothetical protein